MGRSGLVFRKADNFKESAKWKIVRVTCTAIAQCGGKYILDNDVENPVFRGPVMCNKNGYNWRIFVYGYIKKYFYDVNKIHRLIQMQWATKKTYIITVAKNFTNKIFSSFWSLLFLNHHFLFLKFYQLRLNYSSRIYGEWDLNLNY